MAMKCLVILLLVIGATVAQGTVPGLSEVSFHERVLAVYGFLPRNLDKSALEVKSKELDTFWEEVKRRGPAGLADLRKELARNDLPVFFNYDGAKLLLSLSKSRQDRALALAAISRTELRDIQWTDYFYTVHSLAVDGLDSSDAALKILGEDKYQVIVPQHALTLDQEMCLLYLLMPTNELFYLEKVERRLFEEKRVRAEKSLLTLLGYSVTLRGDAAIARFASDPKQPDEARNHAAKIISATKSMGCGSIVGLSFSSYASLKEEQCKFFGRVSDEALYDIRRVQLKLRRKGAK
jgi:hypothetical protein